MRSGTKQTYNLLKINTSESIEYQRQLERSRKEKIHFMSEDLVD